MSEHPPVFKDPQSPEEWQDEVHQTKVRDRLILLRNRSDAKFLRALALVDQTDEFISNGAPLQQFVLSGSDAAKKFVEELGVTYDQLTDPGDVDHNVFTQL